MPIFMTISKHAPENCPSYKEKSRKVVLTLMAKLDGLMKKHGAKVIGMWSVGTEHVVFWMIEASFEAFQKLGMEPEIRALGEFNVSEIKILTPIEESIKHLQPLEAQ